MGPYRDPGGLRVAVLTPCFWPEVRRGAERFAGELGYGLIARGHRPRIITSHPGRLARGVESGLPILRLPRPPQKRLVRRYYEPYLTHVPLTYAALRLGSYDVANSVYPADAVAAVWWKRRSGRPVVLTYMGIPDRPGLRERRRRLEVLETVMRGADAIVALSQHVGDAFHHGLGYEARVIPPAVDLGVFSPARARAQRPTIVCSAAAEEPRKHVGLLVEAFALVRRELPDARLLLARPYDIDAAQRAGVPVEAPGVEWVDMHYDRVALARAYGAAWVSVLPSVSEAFGMVLIEALACGTPVVGYADGAIPEVIDRPEIGRLFDRLDATALARALLDALELAGEPQTAERCRARAAEFSTDRCTEAYLSLYRELGARPSGW